MEITINKNVGLLRIDQDEDVFEQIEKVCKLHNWNSAQISGIGAVKNIELAAYNLCEKKYYTKHFEGIYELVNLQGNVSLKDEKPFLHMHGVIGDESLNLLGGHFMKLTCAILVEIIIHPFSDDIKIVREFNSNLGLSQWSFCPINNI